ncbi:MAG: S-adenosylmethionine:tRNA ribosyltransferase-isomerase [Kofleriaceae bacterium]
MSRGGQLLGHDLYRPHGAPVIARTASRDEPHDGSTVHATGLRTDEISRFAVRLVVIEHAETSDVHAPRIVPFASLPALLRAGDLLVVNDAATLPASLPGRSASGARFELRLSGPVEPHRLAGVLLGDGDFRTRTEHRAEPPRLVAGERVRIASYDGDGFDAVVTASAGRLVELATNLPDDELWRAIYHAGSVVQYAHRADKIDLWSVQTAYASRPWAVEMPSAGRPLTWDVLLGLVRAGVQITTLTHAAGLSSTGDDALDRALPWPERFEIPPRTADAIVACKARGGRVIAVGTTVVRALEAAARSALDTGAPGRYDRATGEGLLRAGGGVATGKLGPASTLLVVDGLISGLHSPGESHFELLQAFAPRDRLEHALSLAVARGLSSHELGDACVILRS